MFRRRNPMHRAEPAPDEVDEVIDLRERLRPYEDVQPHASARWSTAPTPPAAAPAASARRRRAQLRAPAR